MTDDAIKALAASVATLGEAVQEAAGERYVLTLALAALVRTHPDPAAFAKDLRRRWLQSGSRLEPLAAGDPTRAGIESVLTVLEQCCPVPLGIRPPDQGDRFEG